MKKHNNAESTVIFHILFHMIVIPSLLMKIHPSLPMMYDTVQMNIGISREKSNERDAV